MTSLITLFIENLLPVFLAAGSGYILTKIFDLQPIHLSRVVLYIFSPCLVFTLLTQNNLGIGGISQIMLYTCVLAFILGVISLVITKITKYERTMIAAVMISSIFMNGGNYGLPVTLFAFGETALGYASVFFVSMAMLTYTLGVVIASMGKESIAKSFSNLLKVPVLYALILAFVFILTGWQVPVFLERTVTLLSDATIPCMLVLLGMQLASFNLSRKIGPMSIIVVLRLIISPIIAFLLALLFGLTGPARQASVTIAAMPVAVLNTVLATEYNAEPSFVTAAVFVTTILSPLTLTPILALLGA